MRDWYLGLIDWGIPWISISICEILRPSQFRVGRPVDNTRQRGSVHTISSASSSSISTRRRTAFFCSGGRLRSCGETNRQSLAYLHAGQSHLLLAFVGCSEGFVESLVHTSRKAKRGMSPYWTTGESCVSCGKAADLVGRGSLFPLHAITCLCPNTWRSGVSPLCSRCPYQLVFRQPRLNIKSFRLIYLTR